MVFEHNKKYIQQFSRAIEEQENAYLVSEMESLHSADIAQILYQLNTAESKYIIDLLTAERAADVLSEIEEDLRNEFLKNFTGEELASFMDHMDSDDAADMLNELSVKEREEVLSSMDNRERANYILELLNYDDDCAGGLMAKELVKANVNWTVQRSIEEIRRQAKKVEKIHTLYVVDDYDVLLGRVSLKEMILAEDDTLIRDIYVPEIAMVHTYQDEEEVAELMQKYDLEVIPVINIQGKLLGRITIDDIVDVITEQAEIDQQMMSGISDNIEESDDIATIVKGRLPWLLVGVLGGLINAQFMGLFEDSLAVIPILAVFIPLIAATGGNVGIQSSTLVVQALANSNIQDSNWERFMKVTSVAFINGLLIGGLVFLFVFVFFGELKLSLVVSIALFTVVMIASLMGSITPLVLDKFDINPALASGPFITTTNDLIGIAVYFFVARMLLNI
ncbi:magnesium transporter [Sediminitomix flava]|uniref:Magnesium transporter MgtE n=1 Tax=Sediminitomix flava TaxID=379075 RepID=A0A315Z7C1_SEDFL|nr:magnesium transporter [Sediminitomix flava]PWJ40132.1 magnesium transporter [Sediminitomix flava]